MEIKNWYLGFLVHPSLKGVSRLSVLSFEKKEWLRESQGIFSSNCRNKII